jgi:osmoprotectant transport system permease protein
MDRILEVLARPEYSDLLWRHVSLSAAALAIGTVIALVVAMLVSRSPLGAFIAINVGNVGRAVPSLAILALVFPLPGFGFGFNTALVALTALAIPPILINASTALRQVSPQVIDAARGMGFSNSQILGRIKLPIAAPVIFAGIRTSAVQVVASATLATFVGGGGLGDLIVEGYSRGDNYIMLAGAFSVAVLAIITELGFGGLERALTPKGLKVAQKRRGK